ncbi:hypothetical protein OPW41_00135 [Vibrio europaeus]|uniref:hypothetical protein n=1 Tax=Vibrio europaeus TaxID=300876 RepID=UPI00233F35FC|nr:hypothetical protein [Vibrio europaeus]MDC5758014.1 hypothetical protein [Vibrio europaeus]MDC5773592.1 hypothetical protein [Vibrio europaeus]MDC5793228.1 hypothetical protein [Vibrio europaeus]MDC5802707.1 hypothetical protein [Vibrio europaeus]MDC5814649.1 hypothetical protein [Vibrio europaeus]
METPIHSINIDFTHSSEAKELLQVVRGRLDWLSPSSPEFQFLYPVYEQLLLDVELLETLEV